MKISVIDDAVRARQIREVITLKGGICPVAQSACICEEFLTSDEFICKGGLYTRLLDPDELDAIESCGEDCGAEAKV